MYRYANHKIDSNNIAVTIAMIGIGQQTVQAQEMMYLKCALHWKE